MQKNFDGTAEHTHLTKEMLEKINRYTQTPLEEKDVFVFSVVLCDNEIDRDFERFSVDALQKLAPMFEGKTAIKNHSMNADDQSARTFQTEVVCDETRKTSLGEPYTYVKAYCYMPRIPKNEELIAEIGAGIKKEVSVGCAVESLVCSVCGKDARKTPCSHRRGKTYDNTLCYFTLEHPSDAYEWSFVAVPAQKNAGVVKGFDVEKALHKAIEEAKPEGVFLKTAEALALQKELESLRTAAEDGYQYMAELKAAFLKETAKSFPTCSDAVREALCRDMTAKELKEACASLKAARTKESIPTPQLAFAKQKSAKKADGNAVFKL